MSSGMQSCVCKRDTGSAQAVEPPWDGIVCVGSEWARRVADAGQKAVCVQGAVEMDSLLRRGCVSSGTRRMCGGHIDDSM